AKRGDDAVTGTYQLAQSIKGSFGGQGSRADKFFFFQAEDGIRDGHVTGVQTCALPISDSPGSITAGPDGNMWFTETIIGPKVINSPGPNGQIGRITPAGKISTYRLPSGSVPSHITMGPD